jgi:hypothetical protein
MKSNIENVTDYMNSHPMNQLFIIEATSRYAQQVVDNKEKLLEAMKDGMVDGNTWVKSAEMWLTKHSYK